MIRRDCVWEVSVDGALFDRQESSSLHDAVGVAPTPVGMTIGEGLTAGLFLFR